MKDSIPISFSSATQICRYWRLCVAALLCALGTGCPRQDGHPYPSGPTLDLDNGIIRVRAGLDYGGAITYLSVSSQNRNLINNWDRGRQVQQSYYAGQSLDRRAEGQHPAWSPWAWNPIGAGDAYGNRPQVLSSSNDGSTIHVEIIPLLWDMNKEPAECTLETWISLEGNAVHVRNRLTSHRTDTKWGVVPLHQEVPAVYTIGDLDQLYSYDGPAPFTGAPLSKIDNDGPPWVYWGNGGHHEKWAAHVDAEHWGVGVYNPKTESFVGGFSGPPGGTTNTQSTGYIAPLCTESLEKNTVYEYDYYLIVGYVDEIRTFVCAAEGREPG